MGSFGFVGRWLGLERNIYAMPECECVEIGMQTHSNFKKHYPTHIFTKNSRQAKLSRVVHQSVDVILQHFEVQIHNINDVLSLLFSFYPTNFE